VAESVQIAPGGGFAKVRNPWGVLGLSLITLGVFVLHTIPMVGLFAPVYMQMELNKAWRAIGDPGKTQASELPAAPQTDVHPLSVEADPRVAAKTPLSEDSAEDEHPPGPTPPQEHQDDAP
jgi:hypothetical protein